jgi:hypothetical protein
LCRPWSCLRTHERKERIRLVSSCSSLNRKNRITSSGGRSGKARLPSLGVYFWPACSRWIVSVSPSKRQTSGTPSDA